MNGPRWNIPAEVTTKAKARLDRLAKGKKEVAATRRARRESFKKR